MKIQFTKMQGLGNDFIIIENQDNLNYEALAKKMCDRHFGVGADGLIVVNPKATKSAEADICWQIFNSDASEPQMCGNGIRCFAKYVFEKKLVSKKEFKVNTRKGIVEPKILDCGEVRVNMGNPILEASKIPFKGKSTLNFPIYLDNTCFSANAISMGNPHCVIFENDDTKMLAEIFGRRIENHEFFPEKTNVEFVKIISKSKIELNVWERGCGITLACGTGSCAAVVCGRLNNLLDNKVEVKLLGGKLLVEWDSNPNHPVYMTGDAQFVFEGVWYDTDLKG